MDENSPTSEINLTPAPLETSEIQSDHSECSVDCAKDTDEGIENITQILPSALQTQDVEEQAEETLTETASAEEESSLQDGMIKESPPKPEEMIKESGTKPVEDVVQPDKECVPPNPVEKMLGAALTGRKPRPPPPPKRSFTEQELIDLRTAFDLLDRDRDGRVTCSELQFMLKKLGIQVRDELIDDLLKEASQTGNGLIDEAEFLTWVGRIQSLQNDAEPASSQQEEDDDLTQDLIAAFRVFDRDGNGFITRDELQTAMDMIGEHLTENQLNELLSIADLDKDGRINYEEFKIWFKSYLE